MGARRGYGHPVSDESRWRIASTAGLILLVVGGVRLQLRNGIWVYFMVAGILLFASFGPTVVHNRLRKVNRPR